ncbi:hypothetical protein D3C72_1361470 [compost metagenome]
MLVIERSVPGTDCDVVAIDQRIFLFKQSLIQPIRVEALILYVFLWATASCEPVNSNPCGVCDLDELAHVWLRTTIQILAQSGISHPCPQRK